MAGSFVIDGHPHELTELMEKQCRVQQRGSFSEQIKRPLMWSFLSAHIRGQNKRGIVKTYLIPKQN